ncbi:hypothetical protein DFH27DRAFT_597892 [Peziza echinospora]|nr:hypothetical protein DFH27DRAFT_597892 [Peziza echinospora]
MTGILALIIMHGSELYRIFAQVGKAIGDGLFGIRRFTAFTQSKPKAKTSKLGEFDTQCEKLVMVIGSASSLKVVCTGLPITTLAIAHPENSKYIPQADIKPTSGIFKGGKGVK